MTPVISLERISHTYAGPPPVTALHNVSLVVERGEYLAIVGPSGSGKSTLLNVIGLLDQVTTGRYLLDGVNVAALSDAERAAMRGGRIGFVFQAFHLLPYRSALENVMLAQLYRSAPRKARLAAARDSLRKVGLQHRLESMPTHLSGGERQRVAIARALANHPQLLLCDEPTGNLDSATAGTILDLLDELNNEGQTVLTITHDPLVAERAQRLVAIRDGRLTDEVRS
ncbi:ABC transporter ATP-binding protein [Actinomadura sp. 7K534]|uniref:ABC transporter ATP-binding protein n=1 Tax=Actinomadura sp. 7K534 TaxID=2530366 RepID=UPI001050FC47|nr:ABC transporter ATP-binding protein [Actinomadura sp. 7K534]TDB99255.1 ABC transporter ATP-binding protein [Actinomadura sp. 7K534]